MELQFYLKSENAWGAMLAACRNARRSIDFEQYIFAYDDIGKQFYEIFARKAREGITIRLLLDAAGSYSFWNSEEARTLAAAGIAIQFYNPIKKRQFYKLASWFLRDHRKILVVDGETGFTGGVGIEARMRGWRDTHVRISGPAAHQMQHAFDRMWSIAAQDRLVRPLLRSPNKPETTSSGFAFLTNSPGRGRYVYQTLRRMIRKAQHSIYLTTPYFVPSLRLFRSLQRKARQGVDVRILLPEQSDVPTIDIASGSYFTLALKSGIRIFRYAAGVLHAKTAVVDGAWAMAGSSNLDNLSLLFNYEADLAGTDPTFVSEIQDHFLNDIEASHEMHLDRWIKRPLTRKVMEFLTWPLHGFF